MKKIEVRALIIFVLFHLLVCLSAKGQTVPNKYTPIQEVDDILINRYVVYHGDTIDLGQMVGDGLQIGDSLIYVTRNYLSTLLAQNQYNAVTLGDSAIAKGFRISAQQEIEFNYADFVFQEEIGEGSYGPAWENSDSLTRQKQVYEKLEQFASAQQTVFSINLPAASSIYDRIQGATSEDMNGWTLTEISGTKHININHGLGRRVASVTVCSVDGTEERRLIPGNTAYMNWYTTDENNLVIETLCQAPIQIVIYIVFN